ncbi:lytic transglycosylase domain-containing protein, partial [Vibrio parahaemolyticus]|nr:lytic transglycosylase domain-containing protein [Vibrio parahaemolyticus]
MKKMFKIFIIILVLVFGLKTLLFITFPVQHKEIVYKYSTEFNLDPFLVLSIIKVESNFNENAISSKNARGLMQIGETTAKWAAEELKIEDFRIEDL